jgi:hypothetical protein
MTDGFLCTAVHGVSDGACYEIVSMKCFSVQLDEILNAHGEQYKDGCLLRCGAILFDRRTDVSEVFAASVIIVPVLTYSLEMM